MVSPPKQATAFSRRLNRSWRSEDNERPSIALVHNSETAEWERDYERPDIEERSAMWEATAKHDLGPDLEKASALQSSGLGRGVTDPPIAIVAKEETQLKRCA